ncbi:MAG TPA: 5'-nucleotidase C-terminal domain-containing protein, partial [Elusimicrobiales bacterium]|nr:5'-nucleotidase C-terminal domain-containing protein [Elusimicrobiales bacterium]
VLPYDNFITLLEIKGSDILQTLRDNYAYAGSRHMCFSGLRAEFLLNKDGRLRDVRAFIGGKPLNPDRYYTAVTSDYFIFGEASGKALRRGRDIRNTGILIRQPLIDELKEAGKAYKPADLRASEIRP